MQKGWAEGILACSTSSLADVSWKEQSRLHITLLQEQLNCTWSEVFEHCAYTRYVKNIIFQRGIRIGCQKLSNLLSVICSLWFALCSASQCWWCGPTESVQSAKLLSTMWQWAWGDTGSRPTGGTCFNFPLKQRGHSQLVSSRANHRTGVLVAKPLPPQCRVVSGMSKLGAQLLKDKHPLAFTTKQQFLHHS